MIKTKIRNNGLQHRVGRPTKYLSSLKNNPYWEQVKRAIRMRDGYTCTRCGKEGGYEVHHLTYYKNGVSICGRELEHLECLTLLCRNCHRLVHDKTMRKGY